MLRSLAFVFSAAVFSLMLSGCGEKPAQGPGDATRGTGTTPAASPKKDPNGKKMIALIPKTASTEFWKQVEEGAQDTLKDQNYEIVKAGDPADKAEAQLSLVDQMLSKGVDAIVLHPVDVKLLAEAADKAAAAKIPLVVLDSAVDGELAKKVYAYIGTDNKEGGAKCAKALAEAIGKRGNVLLFKFQEGVANIAEREDGFRETIKKEFPDVKIAQEKYAGATAAEAAKSAAEFLAANPAFDGVFASNDISATGMLAALKEKQLAGKVKFVAFDNTKLLADAVESGELVALAAQKPHFMGAEGISHAISAIEKKAAATPFQEIMAEMKDKAALKRDAEEEKIKEQIRKQTIEDKEREEKNKKIQEDNQREVEAMQKKLEAEQKQREEDAKKKEGK